MAFDQAIRNRLARFVTDTRSLLTEEFTRQLQNEYGLDPASGEVTPIEKLTHLDDTHRETASLLRETMTHYLASSDCSTPAKAKKSSKEVLDRIVREQAFTVLNRLSALRMAEARGILIESLARGFQSKGFQLYQRIAGNAMGETGETYQQFLFSIFDEFALDLSALFDRFSPQGRLFPKETTLLQLLDEINHPDIDPLWAEDETIGWIYQYFNSIEERRQMRSESQAPRNSRELAVRNQFFTPRYVVEFLTDNTLGRLWYEMMQGKTCLVDTCHYLVCHPNEIFLEPDQHVPQENETIQKAETQEDLLNQTVYIPYRAIKDPRDIKMLDPACGSMHFGLYAFDLFEKIYDEAWEIEEEKGNSILSRSKGLNPLHQDYPDKETYLLDVPRLIIEHNIHGVDIDPRAAQIAGLSLWLRAQRSWLEQEVRPANRPQIRKSNVVCAEPMPGEADMLDDFTSSLQPKLLGQLLKIIFDKMKLAGEAGTLLKIEDEIKEAIADAHADYKKYVLTQNDIEEHLPGMAPEKDPSLFDFADISRPDDFWKTAEIRLIKAIKEYAEQVSQNSEQRRLFATDAARGFAFIDICRKEYDVAVMNPPFGLVPESSKEYFQDKYPDDWTEIYACFVDRMLDFIKKGHGFLGAITSSLWLYTKHQYHMRKKLSTDSSLRIFIDLGSGVLDTATVDTGIYVVSAEKFDNRSTCYYLDSHEYSEFEHADHIQRAEYEILPLMIYKNLPLSPFCFHSEIHKINMWSKFSQIDPDLATVVTGNSTFDNFRFLRLFFELSPEEEVGPNSAWIRYDKGGHFQPFFNPTTLVWRFKDNALENRIYEIEKNGTDAQVRQSVSYWKKPGLCYSRVTSVGFSPRILPKNLVMNECSISIFNKTSAFALPLLAVLASTHTQDLLDIFGRYRKIENRAVAGLPIDIDLLSAGMEQLNEFALCGINYMFHLEAILETSPVFIRPPFLGEVRQYIQRLSDLYEALDSYVSTLFYSAEYPAVSTKRSKLIKKYMSDRFEENGDNSVRLKWISFILGCVFGRWEYKAHIIDDIDRDLLFDELPALDFNQKQGKEILVDDPGHPLDITGQFLKAKEKISLCYTDQNNLIPNLEIDSSFFKTSFFEYHYKQYSQFQRNAPLYWPLSTISGSYTLWLYYHRLTSQTLYSCVNDFVEPKLKQTTEDVERLQGKCNRSSAEERELEKLLNLEQELTDFRDELLRVAQFWKPNLNDGVEITAAPLWKLFRYRQWSARLKETWDNLEAGEYDWAHLSLSIWPDRVIRASLKKHSYAIAHDLEDQLWHKVKVKKVGRGGRVSESIEWRPRELSEMEIRAIVADIKKH